MCLYLTSFRLGPGRERQTCPGRRLRPHRRRWPRAHRTASARQVDGGSVGVSRRQGRNRRTAGRELDPRVEGGTGYRRQGGLPRAADLCEPPLSRLPSSHAALCLPALGRFRDCAGGTEAQMGAADGAPRLPDAARRRTADLSPYDAHMIRTAEGPKTMLQNLSFPIIASVVRFARDERGATAIEYALVASGIAVAIASTVVSLGSAVKNNLYGNILSAMK